MREAERDLGVVDALRAGGYKPRWAPEWLAAGAAAASSLSQSQRKEER